MMADFDSFAVRQEQQTQMINTESFYLNEVGFDTSPQLKEEPEINPFLESVFDFKEKTT